MAYEPIVPTGLHLGTSHNVPDAVTGHLFDSANNLRGHAAWQWVPNRLSDHTPTIMWVGLGIAIGVAATYVGSRAVSLIKRRWISSRGSRKAASGPADIYLAPVGLTEFAKPESTGLVAVR